MSSQSRSSFSDASNNSKAPTICQKSTYISPQMLSDNMIWLDVFSNEDDLTFTRPLINADRLYIANSTKICISCMQLLLYFGKTVSVIVSNIFVIDTDLISKLLEYSCIDRVFLIINTKFEKQIPADFYLNPKIELIYNNDSVMVMRAVCDNNFDPASFSHTNKTSHTSTNDLSHSEPITTKRSMTQESDSTLSQNVPNSNLSMKELIEKELDNMEQSLALVHTFTNELESKDFIYNPALFNTINNKISELMKICRKRYKIYSEAQERSEKIHTSLRHIGNNLKSKATISHQQVYGRRFSSEV
ncbi:hypothetical protein I4U23_023268 [Adineta vaga]|nr:hypothetical protein I4U23_023268 [Adineta vaga]